MSGIRSSIYLSNGWGVGELTAVKDVLHAAINAQDKDIRKLADDFAALPGTANGFGLIQSEANAVGPRKKPLSFFSS